MVVNAAVYHARDHGFVQMAHVSKSTCCFTQRHMHYLFSGLTEDIRVN